MGLILVSDKINRRQPRNRKDDLGVSLLVITSHFPNKFLLSVMIYLTKYFCLNPSGKYCCFYWLYTFLVIPTLIVLTNATFFKLILIFCASKCSSVLLLHMFQNVFVLPKCYRTSATVIVCSIKMDQVRKRQILSWDLLSPLLSEITLQEHQ